MRKLSLIAALVLSGLIACSTVATAQQAQGKEGKKGRAAFSTEQQLERMTTELNLTDTQKPKVKAVLEDSTKKRQELFNDSSISREDRQPKNRELQEAQNKKLKEILTPEQYTKWEKARAEMRKKRGQGGEGKKKTT